MIILPDFNIVAKGEISAAFLNREIKTFHGACEFIRHLLYGRNSDKSNLLCVFNDNKGTCSTKHAVLKRLTVENNLAGFALMLGIFKMNALNTPKIGSTLFKYGLEYIPEAHTYLKYDQNYFDFTRENAAPEDFLDDLMYEIEIKPDDVHLRKVEIHRDFLQEWLWERPEIPFSLEELWQIREQCIADLSDN
ncbi:hypothetical protein [Sphingobacterium corticibacter]|uniref:Uncharacterized protein n=1 Tax=Sphingobacterium corticibacter TaxID=2171749 RepID=A0A2T8HID5_9SPHI|nr:hypothetical protein [Sphingobacterium corticibacter]PVH25218.1 hypothetical protein DC487_09845 [Sphingobacterium corticibacter]